MKFSVERQNTILIIVFGLIILAFQVNGYHARVALYSNMQDRSQVMQSIGKYADHIREINDQRWDILMRRIDHIDIKLTEHLEGQGK
jgi:hypothetical protein